MTTPTHYRTATTAEALEVLQARLSDVLSPAEKRDLSDAIATLRSVKQAEPDAELVAALRWIMVAANKAKEPCSDDPESPAVIRNGKLASIAQVAAQGLGMVRGPSLAAPQPVAAPDGVWVPKEPTDKMLDEAVLWASLDHRLRKQDDYLIGMYQRMLAAAPAAPQSGWVKMPKEPSNEALLAIVLQSEFDDPSHIDFAIEAYKGLYEVLTAAPGREG